MSRIADLELTSALRISVMRLSRRLRAQRSDDSMSVSQVAALTTLERHGVLTLGDLASHEKVQPPSMTRLVAHLEERGLVRRTPDPSDRRQVLVELTPDGRALLRADRRRRDAWLACRLDDLTAEERDLLRAVSPLLDRLAQS